MKKWTMCYFLLLACFNMFFALFLSLATARYKVIVNDMLEGQAWPLLTERVFQYLWWPWVGVVICVVGATLSLLGKPKANVKLRNLLVAFLIVELGFMFVTMVAYYLPFYRG